MIRENMQNHSAANIIIGIIIKPEGLEVLRFV